jgi:hypothetical protein
LNEREAEYYVGLEVEFRHGMDAVLTVFENGAERERVVLSDLPSKEEMHELLIEKGFERKSEEEVSRIMAERFWLAEEEKAATLKRNEEVVARHRAEIEERKRKEEEARRDEAKKEKVLSYSEALKTPPSSQLHDEL